MPVRHALLAFALAALALPATASAQVLEPAAMRRVASHAMPSIVTSFGARDTTTHASAGDGPWSRRNSTVNGAWIGGTVGFLAGGIIVAATNDCEEDAGLGGVACVLIVPFQVLAGSVLGGLAGGVTGALVGRVLCERHDGGCVDDPPKPDRRRPPPRGPRPRFP